MSRDEAKDDTEIVDTERAVGALREQPGAFPSVAAWARSAGCAADELAGLTLRHFHATPAELLERSRLERAGRLLVEGDRSPAQIAGEVGFGTPAAFERSFQRRMGLSPRAYRALPGKADLEIRLPRSFARAHVLDYLGRDPQSVTDQRHGTTWRGAMRLAGKPARVTVELDGAVARCRLEAGSRLPARASLEAHAKVLRRLGLAGEITAFERRVGGAPDLAPLLANRRGLRIPLLAEPFEGVLWAILGQQVHLGFARTLVRRVVELAGEPAGDGLCTVPTPAAVAALSPQVLAESQLSRAKADYLLGVSATLARGEADLEALARGSAVRAERTLLAMRGLGPWAVAYLMMRGLGFADCVPVGDSGLVRSLERFFALTARPSPAQTLALMEPFRPFRSLATFHFWLALGATP